MMIDILPVWLTLLAYLFYVHEEWLERHAAESKPYVHFLLLLRQFTGFPSLLRFRHNFFISVPRVSIP